MSVMRRLVWLGVFWLVAVALFPSLLTKLPPPLATASLVLAGALVVTGREHLVSFALVLVEGLLSPIYLLAKLVGWVEDRLAERWAREWLKESR